MDAVLDCIDEIALDGLDGCPIQQLWKHLEERRPPFPLQLDGSTKQFLWKGITRIQDVDFFALSEPLNPLIFSSRREQETKNENANSEGKSPLDQFPGPLRYNNDFKLISDLDAGIRGSCPSYHVRKNISEQIRGYSNGDCLDLETAYERWGDCLVMVASQELREKALLGLDCDPNILLSDIQYCLLEHVGQARYSGRMQKTIGSNFLKIDSRTMFHHLKTLRKARLVTMQNVVVSVTDPVRNVRNAITNVVRLKRFHIQEHHKYDVLASRLCKLLLDSPNQELPLINIQKHFSELRTKVLRKVRQFLVQAGYAVEEQIGASPGATDYNDYSPPKKKKRKRNEESSGVISVHTTKLRLLKPFVLKTNSIQQPDGGENDVDDDDEDDDDDDDGDDEEEEGEENEGADGDYDSNFVAEKPLITQAYKIIEQAGPCGFTFAQYRKAFNLPLVHIRAFVKNLKKKKLIQEVHQHVKRQTVALFVAAPFVESNIQALKVKQVQDELKKMGAKAADLNITEGTEPSDKMPKQSKSGIVERVTYRKLKRKALILEYLEKAKVAEGSYPIFKAVISREEEEGLDGRMDRKVLVRILDDLCAQGLIKLLKTVIHHGTSSQTVDLFLHPTINNDDPEVGVTLQRCRARLRDQMFKDTEKEEKAKLEKEKKEREKLEKAAAAAEENQRKKIEKQDKDAQLLQEKEQSIPTKPQYMLSTQKYGHLPRFPRLQLFHELLWQLVHGHVTQEAAQDVIDVDEPKSTGKQQESLLDSDDPITNDVDYEWMKRLKPMPRLCDDAGQPLHGWFCLADVMLVMPLNILCKTVDITEQVDGFDEYAFDPVKKYTLFCDLPHKLRIKIKETRRYHSSPLELVLCLCQMGLVTPALPFPRNFYNIKLFLNKGIKLLDTTSSIRNYRTALPPPGKSFVSRCHMFTSTMAVKNFWSDLKCICLNTPLGLVKIDEGTSDKISSSLKKKRLIHFAKEAVDEDKVDFPPGDQLGAAGLDRCFFSHLKKNWTRVMTISNRKLPKASATVTAEENVQNTDSAVTQGGKTFFSVGKAEMKQQARKERIKQQKKKRKRKAEDSQEDERELASVKKIRTNNSAEKKQVANVREETSKEEGHSCKTGHLNAIDDEDRNILAKKVNERISFSAEEDSWLLLFQVALGVMKNEASRFYPFICMRNILHKECVSSFDKTVPNIRRRILKLMKRPQSQMTVKICSAECAHDESFKRFDDPHAECEEIFQDIVKRLRHKFSSSSLACDGNLTLVSSVKELYDKYKVKVLTSKQTLCSDDSIASLGPGITSVSDINKVAIRDQIQIAFTTPQESYDAYRVFQMFNSYTREELEDVFKVMQKKNLVTRKKSIENPDSQFTRALPFASMTYQLSSVYHRLFLHGFKLVTFYRDCAHFWKQLVKGEQHKVNDPEASDNKLEQTTAATLTPGTIEFRQSRTLGGHVACILSLLTTNKVAVDVSIPDEVLNLDSSKLTENTELQTSPATGESDAPMMKDNTKIQTPKAMTSSENIKGKSATLPSAKTRASDIAETAVHNQPSSPAVAMPTKSSKAGKSAPAVKQSTSSSKTKSPGKGTKERGLEKQEVFTLSLSPSSTVTRFTSPYDLTALKNSSDSLTSFTEVYEGQITETKGTRVSTVPVASLSYASTSARSSRTALMLARGGKDPYASINHLPARAVNTHDFMTLYPCKNVFKLKDSSLANVAAEDEQAGDKEITCATESNRNTAVASSDEGGLDYRTSPVVVSMEVSIEDYIKLSSKDFGFTEMDFPLARIIHNIVEERREFGATVAQLQTKIQENHKHEQSLSQYSLKQHLQYMCRGKLLYKVGSYKECLVSANFVKPWCVTVLKPKDSEQYLKVAPKLTKDGSTAGEFLSAVSVSSKQQGCDEEDQNALEITGIDKESPTAGQTNKPTATSEKETKDGATSEPHDVDTGPPENAGCSTEQTSGQTGFSSETACDTSPNELKSPESGKKKHRIKNYEQYSVVCRPWITIDGDTSQQLLRMFREMVLMLILGNPGISQSQIAKHFFEALRPVALQDILESLLLDGCITKHIRKLPPKMSLFSTSKAQESSESATFYTPTVDCILKLATSKLTGYT